MRAHLQSSRCDDPMEACRVVARVLFSAFGPRLAHATAEGWASYRGLSRLELDARGDLYVAFRVSGDRIGSFHSRKAQWMRLQLALPVESGAASEIFRDLIDRVSPQRACLGLESSRSLVGRWTYRATRKSGALPTGVRAEQLGPGVLYLAEDEASESRLAAWLDGSPEAPQPVPLAPPADRPVVVPSYLKQLAVPTPAPTASTAPGKQRAASENPDETVFGGTAGDKSLPFQGSNVPTPAAVPIRSAPNAGATVALQLPRAAPDSSDFDPDLTQPPVRNPLPVVPFAGTSSPQRIREIAGPADVVPSDEAGETALLPLPEEFRKGAGGGATSGGAEASLLPLREYAAMRAALSASGEDDPRVLARFGVTAADKRRMQQIYFERFRVDAKLRDEFEELLRDEMRKINRGPGGRT
ncbi:MAG: hypothetical protein HOV80_01520 [Polyangiaceae bacterium]|nr:hypothetical protein [Polyangiaceae bacterium]